VSTYKGDRVFVHVLDTDGPSIALPKPSAKVLSASLLRDGRKIEFAVSEFGLLLKLPPSDPNVFDEVIVLNVEAASPPKPSR
jgi:hypothetical protein